MRREIRHGAGPHLRRDAASAHASTYYGAKGDGVADDRAAIIAAMNAAKGAVVYFPAGTYRLGSTLTVPAGTHFQGATA